MDPPKKSVLLSTVGVFSGIFMAWKMWLSMSNNVGVGGTRRNLVMDCVTHPCSACQTGERSSDVNVWTTDISKVLNSPRARKKFHEFVSNKNLEEAEQTLHLWEQIDKIQRKRKERSDLPRNVLLKAYKNLYEYAEEYINFDEAELRQLRRLTKSSSPDLEDEILEMAKQSAQQLLSDDHRHFSSHLWTQMGR